jgi:hypothetical protein
MIYLRAMAIGVIGALLFAVVWMWVALQLPLYWEMWQHRGQGWVAASSVGSESVLLAALVGFVLTFVLIVRRGKRTWSA